MLQKILVPLDGSKLAEQALPYAEALAEKFEAELFLVLVIQTPAVPILADPYGGSTLYTYEESSLEEQRKSAQDYLSKVQEKLAKKKYFNPVRSFRERICSRRHCRYCQP